MGGGTLPKTHGESVKIICAITGESTWPGWVSDVSACGSLLLAGRGGTVGLSGGFVEASPGGRLRG